MNLRQKILLMFSLTVMLAVPPGPSGAAPRISPLAMNETTPVGFLPPVTWAFRATGEPLLSAPPTPPSVMEVPALVLRTESIYPMRRLSQSVRY